ncbi:hypothetical protein [Sphingomonas immobilis]|uniref:Transposase n=1 Tax=Sphingomonas immobilis TaxID=3063997 RepID=A0ABT9A1I7_9SPHN|nr:hypothetical protein [Sphingomonas sp. CA1-15]MDO7842587.1 hypothetical protein [Sphingomonas sp. CA1-15]
MLRTVGSETTWRSVPAGFRIDWGKVDMRSFQDPSWIVRKWRAVTAMFTTLDLLVSSLWWTVVDVINAVRCTIKDAYAAARRRPQAPDPLWSLPPAGMNRHAAAMAAVANDFGYARKPRLAA